MFTSTIKISFRKVLIQISRLHSINQDELLKEYLNEYANNCALTHFQYKNFTLLKDCYNNLYLEEEELNYIKNEEKTNNSENKLELIGYIDNDNDIIFDKLIFKNIINPKKKKIKNLEKLVDRDNQ